MSVACSRRAALGRARNTEGVMVLPQIATVWSQRVPVPVSRCSVRMDRSAAALPCSRGIVAPQLDTLPPCYTLKSSTRHHPVQGALTFIDASGSAERVIVVQRRLRTGRTRCQPQRATPCRRWRRRNRAHVTQAGCERRLTPSSIAATAEQAAAGLSVRTVHWFRAGRCASRSTRSRIRT